MNKPLGSEAAQIGREVAEQFLIYEARLLDERRFREWMALFTEDGTYWVPAVPGQDSPLNEASLFYDDRELMKTRIDRLEHPLIHVQTPPSRTVHLITNVTVEQPDAATGEFVVASNMLMVEYRLERQRIFAGRQRHCLRFDEAQWRIASKRVDLVNCDSAFEAMAVPI
jgi:3-phenylpropionate/cinnamic acid dioxygenase small subunit